MPQKRAQPSGSSTMFYARSIFFRSFNFYIAIDILRYNLCMNRRTNFIDQHQIRKKNARLDILSKSPPITRYALRAERTLRPSLVYLCYGIQHENAERTPDECFPATLRSKANFGVHRRQGATATGTKITPPQIPTIEGFPGDGKLAKIALSTHAKKNICIYRMRYRIYYRGRNTYGSSAASTLTIIYVTVQGAWQPQLKNYSENTAIGR